MSTRANAIRSAAQDDAGHSDNLRTALRHVSILPPPANVEDLVGRLGGEIKAHASADVAEIILDARHPDIPEDRRWFAEPRDDFFAPMSGPANTNGPDVSRLVSLLLKGLFVTAALVGACLIGWNALIGFEPTSIQNRAGLTLNSAVPAPRALSTKTEPPNPLPEVPVSAAGNSPAVGQTQSRTESFDSLLVTPDVEESPSSADARVVVGVSTEQNRETPELMIDALGRDERAVDLGTETPELWIAVPPVGELTLLDLSSEMLETMIDVRASHLLTGPELRVSAPEPVIEVPAVAELLVDEPVLLVRSSADDLERKSRRFFRRRSTT